MRRKVLVGPRAELHFSTVRSLRLSFIFLLIAGAAVAQGPGEPDAKNELAVFGGISILDAEASSEFSVPGFGDLPCHPGLSRLARWISRRHRPREDRTRIEPPLRRSLLALDQDRVAVEADLAIAATHDFDLGGEVCIGTLGCFGEAGARRGGIGRGVTAWHYGGGLAYDVTEGDVRPFLVVGAGGVTWDGASDTDFVFRFGGGLKLFFGKLGLRVDVTDHLVLDHFLTEDNEHDVHATAGFLVRF